MSLIPISLALFAAILTTEARADDGGAGRPVGHIDVLAMADPAGAVDRDSDIIITAQPAGALLGPVQVKVFQGGSLLQVINVNGSGLPQLDITDSRVRRGQHLVVSASTYELAKGEQSRARAQAETDVLYRPHLTLAAQAAPKFLTTADTGTFVFALGEDSGDLGASAHFALSDGGITIADARRSDDLHVSDRCLRGLGGPRAHRDARSHRAGRPARPR
jgi:hypothetical protein